MLKFRSYPRPRNYFNSEIFPIYGSMTIPHHIPESVSRYVASVYIAVIGKLQHVTYSMVYHSQPTEQTVLAISISAHSTTLVRVCIGCLHYMVVENI